MNGFLLLVPFLILRFGLLACLGPDAVQRAAHYPPAFQAKRGVYWVYQLSTLGIFVYSGFLTVKSGFSLWWCAGLVVYGLGLILCAVSMIHFAAPAPDGLRRDGLYRISRNPMYVAYFVCFAGCALLTQSPGLFGILIVFQLSGHWLVLAEEQWCLEQFGAAYQQYMREVRRYI